MPTPAHASAQAAAPSAASVRPGTPGTDATRPTVPRTSVGTEELANLSRMSFSNARALPVSRASGARRQLTHATQLRVCLVERVSSSQWAATAACEESIHSVKSWPENVGPRSREECYTELGMDRIHPWIELDWVSKNGPTPEVQYSRMRDLIAKAENAGPMSRCEEHVYRAVGGRLQLPLSSQSARSSLRPRDRVGRL